MLVPVLAFLLVGVTSAAERQLFELYKSKEGLLSVHRVSEFGVAADVPVARSTFIPAINETGWAFYDSNTDPTLSTDEEQAYNTGLLEGSVTHDLIYMHWYNTLGDFCKGRAKLCQNIDNYIKINTEWVDNQVNNSADNYWYQVLLFYKQLQGMAEGYNRVNKDPATALTYKDLLYLNLQGDFEDLEQVFQAQETNFKQPPPDGSIRMGKFFGKGHCSALIKVLPDGSDVLVAQDTWSSYQSMLRIQKKYTMRVRVNGNSNEIVAGSSMSFSSYPGVITSGDDFYVVSSGLVTLETTIGNSNASLWKFVQPMGQVFEGIRAMVANRLAKDGLSWSSIFEQYNSGTYNNQWMVVNYNKFKPGTKTDKLKDGLLWVLEQIPGYVRAADMSSVLRSQSYWPSYNVAAFPEIFNLSGNLPMVEKFGDWFTYDKTPRALIFKRDHVKVKDLKSMMALMRYNDYTRDPLSRCDCQPPYSAENAIAARCDMNPANGTYPFSALGHRSHGATDSKITSQVLFSRGLQFMSVSGPIYNESNGIPPFQWSKADFIDTPHLGHPDLWTFQPLVHQWERW